MVTANGQSGLVSPTNDVVSGPIESPLGIAIQVLQTISAEAQQAVRKLDGLLGLPPVSPASIQNPNGSTPPTPRILADAVGGRGSLVTVAPAAVPNGPTAKAGQMKPGDVLHPGDSLASNNGNYVLAMQRDGNLVIYSGTSALWASNTAGKPVAVCIMQGDGNLVLYNNSTQAVWASNTSGRAGAHLVVQDDGNVVIVQTNGVAAWATNTVHTIGSNTLIFRARLKRWTNIPFFGTKGNDAILVKLPPGASLKSVYIGPVDASDLNPSMNSPIGTQIGSSFSGARLTNVQAGQGFVAIATHWWFNAFADAEYSIFVWVTGPTAYPVEDNGTLSSANMDSQIVNQIDQWFMENGVKVAEWLYDVLVELVDGTAQTEDGSFVRAVSAGSQIMFSPSSK